MNLYPAGEAEVVRLLRIYAIMDRAADDGAGQPPDIAMEVTGFSFSGRVDPQTGRAEVTSEELTVFMAAFVVTAGRAIRELADSTGESFEEVLARLTD